jgi:hypothetical protein
MSVATAMTPEIKSIFCSDVPVSDLADWMPDNPNNVYACLDVSIGETGKGGAELFRVMVTTPVAIAGRPDRRRRELLVVQKWDWQKVLATLET